MTPTMDLPFIILSQPISPTPEQVDWLGHLAEWANGHGLDVAWVADLYHLPEDCDLWPRLAQLGQRAVVATWLHARPAEWLLHRHGVGAQSLTMVSLADCDTMSGAVAVLAEALPATSPARRGTLMQLEHSSSSRWYPVVDRSRCVNCQHCLQFCLFGVYSVDDAGQVRVTHPDQCKTGCPACSRICPHSAIMFPLYDKSPAIAGAPGQFVTLDPAARRMFYVRTNRPCPVCGQTGKPADGAQGEDCPECARPLAGAPLAAKPLPFDDLDTLIDDLDKLMQRRR